MPDWTTRKISNDVEIDLHPDLNSFPAQIRSSATGGNIVLSKEELSILFDVLLDYYGADSVETP